MISIEIFIIITQTVLLKTPENFLRKNLRERQERGSMNTYNK